MELNSPKRRASISPYDNSNIDPPIAPSRSRIVHSITTFRHRLTRKRDQPTATPASPAPTNTHPPKRVRHTYEIPPAQDLNHEALIRTAQLNRLPGTADRYILSKRGRTFTAMYGGCNDGCAAPHGVCVAGSSRDRLVMRPLGKAVGVGKGRERMVAVIVGRQIRIQPREDVQMGPWVVPGVGSARQGVCVLEAIGECGEEVEWEGDDVRPGQEGVVDGEAGQ